METLYTNDQIFIPIISDYGFKATFGNEANTLFLRKALQALIKSEVPIKEVKFDKNTFEGITQDGRSGIFDLACTDENDNHFIVEMQYGDAPYFVQRMKFYALHKFNAMVKRGKFDYGTLTKIYCVAILANNIQPYPSFHTVANLRSEQGEIFDEQLTFITVELDKFTQQALDCQTDLQKLSLYHENAPYRNTAHAIPRILGRRVAENRHRRVGQSQNDTRRKGFVGNTHCEKRRSGESRKQEN
jgi:predicted transposase/invertase (TIGR01784 family)